jgi:hypothetical protein
VFLVACVCYHCRRSCCHFGCSRPGISYRVPRGISYYRAVSRTVCAYGISYYRVGSHTALDLIQHRFSYCVGSYRVGSRTSNRVGSCTSNRVGSCTVWDLVQRGILYSAGSKHESPQICDHEELQHEFVIDV